MKTKGPIRFYLCWMLFMFCGVILYLGSCSDSDTVDSGTTDEYITISPFINNGVTTLIAGNNFEENDSIGLYVVSYEQDNTTPGSITSASAVNVQHIFRQSAWLLPSGGKLPWPSLERQVDLYSYYPFDAQLNSLNPLQYPFTVQGDQRTKDNYLLSDFLWSKTENVSPTSRPVSMIFSHKLSKVRVNVLLEVENLQNEVDQAIVSVVNVNPTGNINLSDGSVALAGNAPENIITYKYSTPAAGYNLSAEGIIIPQQATQGQPFIRIEFPLTGVRYHFIPEQNIPFEQGMERTINITISELGISVTVGEIIEWRPSEIIEGEIGKPIPRVLDLGSIDWNASRIHHLYYDGVWIGDACREYLFGGGIDAQAIVIYSVDAQSSLDTSTGFVGQVMNRNRNPATNEYFPNTSAVHGGQVNWGTNNQISSYVAGTSAVTNKIEFRDDGSFVGVPDVYITNIETAPYLMTDIDGNSYPIVKIAQQYWMAENLRVRNFNNGTPLTAYVYNNNSAYEATYGLLYTWYTMTSDNGIAPDGWRTFSYDDFYTLYEYLTPDAGRKLKANVLWGILGANNDDVTGFRALPGGYRLSNGTYNYLTASGYWWTTTMGPGTNPRRIRLITGSSAINAIYDISPGYATSVRLLRE